jgi:hypothetical protein
MDPYFCIPVNISLGKSRNWSYEFHFIWLSLHIIRIFLAVIQHYVITLWYFNMCFVFFHIFQKYFVRFLYLCVDDMVFCSLNAIKVLIAEFLLLAVSLQICI